MTDEKKILALIKKHQPLEQSKIIKSFQKKRNYSTNTCARVYIGKVLKKLEDKNLIYKTKEPSNVGIPKNVWRNR